MIKFTTYILENDSPSLSGEYWIVDGNVQYADGDIGETNHEGYALDAIQRNVIEKYPYAKYGKFLNNEYVDWDAFQAAIIDEERNISGHINVNNNEQNLLKQSLRRHNINDKMWMAANGQLDAREYAIEHYGWKAVRGDNVETWHITRNDMKEIADGIESILSDEGIEEEDDNNLTFSVYVYTKNYSYDFTLAELKNGLMPGQKPQTQYGNVAAQQVKAIDKQKMHPYYQQKTFGFGDAVTFKGWLLTN